MHFLFLISLVLLSGLLAGCTPNTNVSGLPTPAAQVQTKGQIMETPTDAVSATQVRLTTAKGIIEIELYPIDAPKTVTNFATLIKRGYYDNLTFHRVEPGFVIQGGDPSGNGTGGQSIYGSTFEDELFPGTTSYLNGYKKGVVAMANRGPNTNGSQFFIMLEDTALPPAYTIFGKVTKGMEVVEKIAVGDKISKAEILK